MNKLGVRPGVWDREVLSYLLFNVRYSYLTDEARAIVDGKRREDEDA